jgi:SPP1 gp7 family putative phage head morphogenesis protein
MLQRMSTSLVTAVDEGWTTSKLADAMDAVLGDPARADMISTTELARAVSQASLDTYKTNGITQVAWEAADNPCEALCLPNAEAGPITTGDSFPSGVDAPPAHPLCRCALIPITEGQTDG